MTMGRTMASHDKAPIALFVYNRPWHTRQTITALQKNKFAEESDLFIFSDAEKDSKAAGAVREVRDYVNGIEGFNTLHVVERAENLGLANSIIDGVTCVCEEHGRVIVLEDDLVTSPFFLEYMNAALERYANEEQVMQIAGYMFPVKLEVREDALFLPFISSWGWATWKRAWRHFDPLAQGYERLLNDATLREQFDLNGHYKYFEMLQAQRRGKVDSWAIRWYLTVFLRQGLALYPRKTLVQNLGFDGSGLNCGVSELAQADLESTFRVSSLPSSVKVSPVTDTVFNSISTPRRSLAPIWNKAMGLLKGIYLPSQDGR
jgi:hypothetical protein